MEYKKLNPEFKVKWLEALRSGKYPQTQECLKDDGGFCCLGVAADIIYPEGWAKKPEDDFYIFTGPDGVSTSTWFKGYLFKTTNLDELAENELMTMNDTHKKSFAEIADWIEENL